MARDSSGNHTLPAGNPVVTATTIETTWANNTMSDISNEITDSLSRSGQGPMTAPLELTDGSAGTPALSFDSDTDSGLYRVGANSVGMSAGGTQVLRGTATGVVAPLGATCTQSQSNTTGITTTGNGTAAGIAAVGGSSDGAGGIFTGGATNSHGVGATGAGTGSGITATGGATGSGGTFTPGTAAVAGTNRYAVTLHNGHLLFSTAVNPTSTVAQTNTLTPMNLVKAWGRVNTDGVGGAAVDNGQAFNVASVAIAGTALVVTLAQAMANDDYAVVITGDGARMWSAAPSSTTVFSIGALLHDGNTYGLDTNAISICFIVMGAQ